MKNLILRYKFFLVMVALWLGVYFFKTDLALRSIDITLSSIKEMLLVIPPIFLLLGLFDVWVPRQTMIRFMGEGSGVLGILLSFLGGAMAAGPLYGAFPVAAVFLKKSASLRNVFVFIGAWSTLKIPMFLFELQSLGVGFAVTRLALNIPGILVIAWVLDSVLNEQDKEEIYRRASSIGKD